MKSLTLILFYLTSMNFVFGNLHCMPPLQEETTDQAEGEMIKVKTSDDKSARAFVIPARVTTDKWLFIYPGELGLSGNVKDMARKYHENLEEINVMAIDLYDAKIATDTLVGRRMMPEVDDRRVRRIVEAAIKHAGDKADIGVIGWGQAAEWSVKSAVMLGPRADACVMFYGAADLTAEELEKLRTPILGIFADNDYWMTFEELKEFRSDMKKAEASMEIITLDANNAFPNPNNEDYNTIAAQKAHSAAVKFVRGYLNTAQ